MKRTTNSEKKDWIDPVLWTLSFVLGLCLLLSSMVRADDELLPLRRVYIPADRLPELGERYGELRSVSRQEFEELLRRAQLPGQPLLPHVESAKYRARLEGNQLIGTAELQVRGRTDSKALLRWPASPWTISGASWDTGPASLGYVGRGELGVLVPQGDSHKLTFSWAADARLSEAGRRFDLKTPTSVHGEMVLDLPRGLSPVTPIGLLTGPTDSPRPDLRQWLIRCSPADSLNLVLVSEEGSKPFPALLFYENETEVDLSEEDAELQIQFDLHVAHQPVSRIQFDCSPGLKVFAWSGVKLHDWQEEEGRVTLDLAEPLLGSARMLLRAIAPGPTDGQWKLPRLTIRDGLWTGGRLRVRSSPGLQIHDVQPFAGQFSAASNSEGDQPELLVEETVADLALSVRVSPENPQIFANVHTSLELGPAIEATATVIWQIASGETSVLRLQVPDGWTVQNVDVQPKALLSRWSVDSDESRGPVATLRFSRPLSKDISISASLHLTGPPAEETADTTFVIPRLRPVDSRTAEETVTLPASPLWSTELVEANQFAMISKSSTGSPFGPESSPARSYRFEGPDAAAKILVHRQPAEIAANLDTAIELDEERTRAKYMLEIESTSGQVDWLLVHFSVATGSALAWELPEGAHAQRLEDEANSNGVGETWRLTLPRKATRRIRLAAVWLTPSRESTEVPLPMFDQTVAMTGLVRLSVPQTLRLETSIQGLLPSSDPNGLASQHSGAPNVHQHVWRYGRGAPQLDLRTTLNPDMAGEAAWIARAHVRTVLDGLGDSVHYAHYDLQSQPDSELTIRMPRHAVLRQALSSGQPVSEPIGDVISIFRRGTSAPWTVDLEYSLPSAALGRWDKLNFELPQLSLRAMRVSWEVVLPPSHAVAGWANDLSVTPPWATTSWTRRLFGSLVRDNRDGPFEFWRGEAWRDWWKGANVPPDDPMIDRLQHSLSKFLRDVRPQDRTWARLIAHIDQFTEWRLVVDALSVELAGIDLDTTIPSRSDSSEENLLGLTNSTELILLRTKRGLLLTSRRDAAVLCDAPEASGIRRLGDHGGLPQAIDQALANGSDASGRFVLMSNWNRPGPSGVSSFETHRAAESATGLIWRFETASDPKSVSVTLVQKDFVVQSIIVVAGFLCWITICTKARSNRLWRGFCAFAFGGALASAVLLPDGLAEPAAWLAWIQLAIVLLSRWKTRERPDASEPVDYPTALPRTIMQVSATGALLLFLVSRPTNVTGGSIQEERAATTQRLVFIPYDADHPEKRGEASRFLVPRAILDRLRERANSMDAPPAQVLIRSAVYSGKLTGDRFELAVDLDLENVAPVGSARCSVPLSGILIRSAEMDGKPCLLENEPNGFSVGLPEPGPHRLRVEGVLSLGQAAPAGVIELAVPPVPIAKLDVEVPPDVAFELDHPIAGQLNKASDKQRFSAEFGAVNRLIARWSRGPIQQAVLRTDSATLFTWRPGSQRLESHIHVRVESGLISRLVLEPDPRLVPVEVRAAGMAGYWLRTVGEMSQLVVEFERPVDKHVMLVLDSIVREPSAESVTLPEVAVAQSSSNTRIVALRGMDGRSIQVVEPVGGTPATVEEFQRLWEEPFTRTPGTAILLLADNSHALELRNLVADAKPVFKTQNEIRVSAARMELASQLVGQAAAGKWMREELVLPAGLDLKSVRVSSGMRWTALDSNRILWFGKAPENGQPSIEIIGCMPMTAGAFPLPAVRPSRDCQLTGEGTVWQSRELSVSMEDVRGLRLGGQKLEPRTAAGEFAPGLSFAIDTSDFAATLQVERLSARLTATVASRVRVEEGGVEWISVVDYQIENGSASEFELRLPDAIGLPVQLVGEGIYRREIRREGSDQIWRILLDEPRWNSYRILLRTRLEPGPEGKWVVPSVSPEGVAQLQRFLLLLNSREQQVQVRGIENQLSHASESFSKWFSEPITKDVLAAVELRDPLGTIEIAKIATESASSPPRGVSEWHRCWLRSDGSVVSESHLLLRARTAGELPLLLPESAVLLGMEIDGFTVRPCLNEHGQPLVPLGAHNGPHSVHVRWSWNPSPVSKPARNRAIDLPTLTSHDCPSGWTVFVPAQVRVESSTPPSTCRSLVEVKKARAIAEEIELSLPLPKPAEGSARAATIWDMERAFLRTTNLVRRTLEIEAEIGVGSHELQNDHKQAAQELARLLGENRQVLNDNGLAALLARAEMQVQQLPRSRGADFGSSGEGEMLSTSSSRSLDAVIDLPSNGRTVYLASDGQGVRLVLREIEASHVPAYDWLIAGLIGFLGTALCLLLESGRWSRFGMMLVLALAGVLWCWMFRPEPIGPVLLLMAILTAIYRMGRRLRSARQHSPALLATH